MKLSIITPWLDHPELIAPYEASYSDAEVIVVDNGSVPANAEKISKMVKRMGGIYIRNETNRGFSEANNQGMELATGDAIAFINNDTSARKSFVRQVLADVTKRALYGVSKGVRMVDNYAVSYLEGWCIAAKREVWHELGRWPVLDGLYWEDNILCLKAHQLDIPLIQCGWWPIEHFSNWTSRNLPGAYDHSAKNAELFAEMVRKWKNSIL